MTDVTVNFEDVPLSVFYFPLYRLKDLEKIFNSIGWLWGSECRSIAVEWTEVHGLDSWFTGEPVVVNLLSNKQISNNCLKI